MDSLPNINYIHVQAKTYAIIIVIYLINVLHTFVPGKRVDKDFNGPLINESGIQVQNIPSHFEK